MNDLERVWKKNLIKIFFYIMYNKIYLKVYICNVYVYFIKDLLVYVDL